MTDRVVPPDQQKMMGATEEIRALEYELRRYPPMLDLIRSLVANLDRYERVGITTPADLLGDRALHALMTLLGDHDDDFWQAPDHRLQYARAVLDAIPVLWPIEMVSAALALPLPPHVISPDVMPYPLMWWRFQQPRGPDGEVESLLLIADPDGDEGITVLMFGSHGGRGEVRFSGSFLIGYHKQWPDDFTTTPHVEAILQMLAFMNSRYVSAEAQPLGRAERRRIQHAGLTELDGGHEAHVIRLRAPEPTEGTGGSGGSREWAHRWFVRGHYRAQWYPSLGAHRVRWIAAYVKGPQDKPIALPVVKIQQ